MFYSKTTGGFYSVDIHGENIPADAVEITPEYHSILLDGQSSGKIISANDTGFPVLSDPAPLPLADQQLRAWELIKNERDRRMKTGGYQVASSWFHSDEFSRSQQQGLVLLGDSIPPDLQWKTMDGSFVTMTKDLAQQIFAASVASDRAIFDAAEQHNTQMLASSTPLEYYYLSNWPKVYGE